MKNKLAVEVEVEVEFHDLDPMGVEHALHGVRVGLNQAGQGFRLSGREGYGIFRPQLKK